MALRSEADRWRDLGEFLGLGDLGHASHSTERLVAPNISLMVKKSNYAGVTTNNGRPLSACTDGYREAIKNQKKHIVTAL